MMRWPACCWGVSVDARTTVAVGRPGTRLRLSRPTALARPAPKRRRDRVGVESGSLWLDIEVSFVAVALRRRNASIGVVPLAPG